jgi:Fe-S-cluster-containing dehydrogenase component
MPRVELEPAPFEFESGQDRPPSELSRREFLALGGAALALTSQVAGCTRAPAEKIVPYRVQPGELVPGRALHYASAVTLDGYATGVLVESHEGRPTKLEGNPEHPASLGATSALEQALIFELYDPARLRAPARRGRPASESELTATLVALADPARAGRGVHLVLPPLSSPLVASQLARLRARLPELELHFHAPLGRTSAWQGARLTFGVPLETRAEARHANVILALDADVLASGPGQLAFARGFAERRRAGGAAASMNRLYVVETAMSVTGGMADHRLALRPSELASFTLALLREVVLALGGEAPREAVHRLAAPSEHSGRHGHFVGGVARDLLAHRGSGLVLAGDRQPPFVHAAVNALNVLLGNVGSAVEYAPSPIFAHDEPDYGSLRRLHDALASHAVETLLVFDTDVAYASPADLELGALLGQARESLYFGLFENQTAAACAFQVPAAHVLESWLDTRSLDGTTSLVQPLLAPLYGGRTLSELLGLLLGEAPSSAHGLLETFWRAERPRDFAAFWETSLSRGVVEATAFPATSAAPLAWGWVEDLVRSSTEQAGIELNLCADSRLHDGRFGDNPWLLELPCSVTKQTWGNAAQLAPALAQELGVVTGDVLALTAGGRTLDIPALIVPGHAERAVSVTFGWGRRGAEPSRAHGANAYLLLSSAGVPGIRARPTGRHEELAITQAESSLGVAADSILRFSTLAEYRSGRATRAREPKRLPSLYVSDAQHSRRQWGMTIDLNACTGCSACVLACQVENNVPVVGKSGVLKHRELHWLRIDRYVVGSARAPRVLVQPMACQHCEKAPCEYVCPTGATVHSSDGLNQMVYNRCVGTRFCSNNCPYKVRRFNWFDYRQGERSPRELAANPEVTVRERGVMEKCTYCVQRIRKAEINARNERRPLIESDVTTACAQACASQAIAFGDVNDPASTVATLRGSDRAFQVLEELGAVPRTRYLMQLKNPNPELA